jgi:hypothetical protein
MAPAWLTVNRSTEESARAPNEPSPRRVDSGRFHLTMTPLPADNAYSEEATTMNKLIGVMILGAVAAVGVGCGGDQPRPSDPTTTTTTQKTTTMEQPAAPPPAETTTQTTTTTQKKP